MKTFIRYITCFIIALSVSWIVFIIVYQIAEYINPSERYDANGNPQFIMPIAAALWGAIASVTTLILITTWTNKIFKNRFIKK